MKKRLLGVLLGATILLTGCQATTKSLGGSMTLKLPPNQKLEEITWKDDSLSGI